MSIKEHLERECTHPYCGGVAWRRRGRQAGRGGGSRGPWTELLSSRVATHGVSPSAMAATVAKAMGGAPPSYGGVRDNFNVLGAGREAES